MNKEQRLKKRYNAEKRFKLYGLTSILLAIFFVIFLLNAIFSKGSGAFLKTTIDVEVNFDADTLELSESPPLEDLENTDYYELAIDSILKVKKVNGLTEEKLLINLFSPDYEYEIRNFLLDNPKALNQTTVLKLTASDDFDQLHKGNYPRELPEERRRINNFQLNLYDELVNEGKVNKIFNSYLFTKGDSRNPELAGIGGALFFTIVITLLLSFPIAIAASVYLEEFAPKNKITDFIEININNLAAVPSIVFGLLGLGILLGTFHLPRSTPLVAGITLALMTLPRIIIPCRASLKAVPPSIREGALAIGASKVQSVTHHVLPLAIPGTLSGTIIGLAQALGETAPLILIGMVAFVVDIPSIPTDPSASLPVQVYLWSEQAERGFVEKTSATIMVLLSFLITLNFIAVYLRQKFERKW